MQLVMLAAGYGTRFGGLKQLAPVGPNGEAIMDYTARSAKACGFDGVVLVVRDAILDEVRSHVAANWPQDLPVDFVCQPPVQGTAQAVLSAEPAIDGSFGVANADDLYGHEALAAQVRHFAPVDGDVDPRHLIVGYHLSNTVLTTGDVKRGLCDIDADGNLATIKEHLIKIQDDGTFLATPLGEQHSSQPVSLDGTECVSMNLWGFHRSIFEHLAGAVSRHKTARSEGEILLPDVVGALVAKNAASFRVVVTEARCMGITHREDLCVLQERIAHDHPEHDVSSRI